ncbi:hypothetical protein [Streptomyces sp. NPDC126514]|uniref:hypothetical protein n=1 Tax=Streptomyces sp. NPDC126514 TaxID=3155210 RepID=UPI00332B1654
MAAGEDPGGRDAAARRDGEALGTASGADWATGGLGRVESVTKSTVTMTAATLAAVQVAQMIR